LDYGGSAAASFLGRSVDASAVLVRFTLAGDATLDGRVDFDDLVKLAQNYNVADGQRAWVNGDFDYDGDVDFEDLVKLAQNYNSRLPTDAAGLAGAPAGFAGDVAAAMAAVPEPGWSLVAVAAGVGYACRGRRRGAGCRVRWL
jgi:hypothetical protein